MQLRKSLYFKNDNEDCEDMDDTKETDNVGEIDETSDERSNCSFKVKSSTFNSPPILKKHEAGKLVGGNKLIGTRSCDPLCNDLQGKHRAEKLIKSKQKLGLQSPKTPRSDPGKISNLNETLEEENDDPDLKNNDKDVTNSDDAEIHAHNESNIHAHILQ